MAFEKRYDELEPVNTPPCIHMRSKAMYVSGEYHAPDHPDEEAGQHCWCNLSQHVLGPDKEDVDRRSCSPGRDCYRETY